MGDVDAGGEVCARAARERIKVTICGRARVAFVVRVCKLPVVVRLAAAVAARAPGGAGVQDDVARAVWGGAGGMWQLARGGGAAARGACGRTLGIADVVLATAEDHEVVAVLDKLTAVVVVKRPHSIVCGRRGASERGAARRLRAAPRAHTR